MFLPGTVGAVVGSHCDVPEELPLGLLTTRLCEEQPYVKLRHSAPDVTLIWLLYLLCVARTHTHTRHACLHLCTSYAVFGGVERTAVA